MSNQNYQGKIFLVIGQSQKGKSSWIKDITGAKGIAVGGLAKGLSCTSQIKCYTSTKHFLGAIFVDTVGLYGTDLITKEKLIQTLQWFLINKNLGKSIAGIIMIQSYNGDNLSTPKNIQLVNQIFGKTLPQSMAVFMTKKNLTQNEPGWNQDKRASVEQQATSKGISLKNILDVQTTYANQPTIINQQQQVQQIGKILSILKPIQLSHIQQKLNKIEARAQQMRLQQKTIGYSNVSYTVQVARGGLAGLFGGTKDITCNKVVPYDIFPSIEQCRIKATQQLYQKIRASLLLK